MDDEAISRRVFVLRIGCEQGAGGSVRRWRGTITEVPSGRQHAVADLGAVTDFVAEALRSMGVAVNRRDRVRQWWGRMRARLASVTG